MKKVPPGEAAHFFSARAWSRKAGTIHQGHAQTNYVRRKTLP
jgi:hypothetical protein